MNQSTNLSSLHLKVLPRLYPITFDAGGMWPVRVSAQLSAVWDIVLWKYIVPKLAAQMARPRRLTTATVAASANLMTKKAAMETVTRVAGSTRLGQR